MSKEELDLNRAREMLSVFLEEPTMSLTFSLMRPQFKDWDESTMRKYLKKFEAEEVFIVTGIPGRPKGGNRRKSYQIATSSNAFRTLYQKYYKDFPEKLLDSNYANLFIEQVGFREMYKLIESDLERSDFRIISTKILLNHPSTIAEYEGMAEQLSKSIFEIVELLGADSNRLKSLELLSHIKHNIESNFIESLSILGNLDQLQSIKFYRNTVHETFVEVIRKLWEKCLITEGVFNFFAFDTYLSPLTSYPINDLSQLILSPYPFQRIFEDAYLIDKDAFAVLSGRAAAINNFFVDILFELIKDNMESDEIITITKELIFYWNVASTRFDYICLFLEPEYREERRGSGNYHIKCDGISFQIFDLANNERLLPEDMTKETLKIGSLPSEFEIINDDHIEKNMKNPFTRLRPCRVFEGMGYRSNYIPIKEILKQLNLILGKDGRKSI